MSFADITTEVAAYAAAINARDYALALDKALILAGLLAANSDVRRGGNGSFMDAEWKSAQLIVDAIPTLRKRATATGAGGTIQVTNMIPTRAGLTA